MWPCGPCQRVASSLDLVPSIAFWVFRSGIVETLCQTHLDAWFDDADNDPESEPCRVLWVDQSRHLRADYLVKAAA